MSEAKNESSANGATSNDLLGVFAAVSEWRHTNGNLYHVLCIANEHTERPDQYPVTVVYQGNNGRIWSRPLSDWHRSMTPNGMGSCAKVHVAPAGWQLVPVEPTIGMCIAGDSARVNVDDATRTPAIYRAMLASAPKGGE